MVHADHGKNDFNKSAIPKNDTGWWRCRVGGPTMGQPTLQGTLGHNGRRRCFFLPCVLRAAVNKRELMNLCCCWPPPPNIQKGRTMGERHSNSPLGFSARPSPPPAVLLSTPSLSSSAAAAERGTHNKKVSLSLPIYIY